MRRTANRLTLTLLACAFGCSGTDGGTSQSPPEGGLADAGLHPSDAGRRTESGVRDGRADAPGAKEAQAAESGVTDALPGDSGGGTDAHPRDTGSDVGAHDAASKDTGTMADAGTAWSPAPCTFYVAASGGSDSNPGTRAKPFNSLKQLQTALQGSTTKVGCLKAGSGSSYNLATALVLAHPADDGETWESDPEGGVNSAILDGGGTASCLIQTDADDITIDGLTLQHVVNNLTCHDNGTTSIKNLTITSSDLSFNTNGPGSGHFPPCLMANGVDGATITHNYVHDCASEGIGVFSYQSGLVLDHVVIDSNVVLRAVQKVSDGGAIYLQMVNNYTATSIEVTNNFVRDYGTATIPNAHGIYLDEGTNHVVVSGNTIGAPTPGYVGGQPDSTGCLLADGHDNHFSGNICDVGLDGVGWSGVWWYPAMKNFTPANNVYRGNVVVSHFSGNQKTSYTVSGFSFDQSNAPSGDPTIADNVYFNYGGGQVRTDGNQVSDSSPRTVDPLCSGNLYTLAAGSPAFAAPTSFSPVVGAWGPPGFVISEDSNRSCP